MMQYDPVYDNPAKPGFLKDGFLTPTAILTSAQGFTAARRVVEKGADKVRAAILTQRIDAAKLPIYLVALFRWQELEAFAVQTGQPWPLPETTLVGAYAEWSRVFTANRMSLGLGAANGCCDNTTSFYKLVFNLSKSTMAQGPPQLKSDDAADKNTAGPTATTSIAWSEPVIMHGAWETRWTGGPNGAAHAIRIDGNESTGPPPSRLGPPGTLPGAAERSTTVNRYIWEICLVLGLWLDSWFLGFPNRARRHRARQFLCAQRRPALRAVRGPPLPLEDLTV